MKYMVMECQPGYAVVMDESGRFLKVVNRQYQTGQLITQVTPVEIPVRKPGRWMYTLAAMAACLALLLTVVLPSQSRPYASVYVKINPEVRIDVDRHDRVVGLAGVNADGAALIEGYDYRKKDLTLVTDELVELAMEADYLQPDGTVSLSLDCADEAWIDGHSQVLSEQIRAHCESVTVEVCSHHGGHHSDTSTAQTSPNGESNHHNSATEPEYDRTAHGGNGHSSHHGSGH